VFERAKQLGLPVKLHAEQLSDLDGAALVAEYGGLSADHLEYLSDSGIAGMAPPAPSPCCFPARSTRCAKPNCRR
jgi:imidazolonepropionase-like amidohydrolase